LVSSTRNSRFLILKPKSLYSFIRACVVVLTLSTSDESIQIRFGARIRCCTISLIPQTNQFVYPRNWRSRTKFRCTFSTSDESIRFGARIRCTISIIPKTNKFVYPRNWRSATAFRCTYLESIRLSTSSVVLAGVIRCTYLVESIRLSTSSVVLAGVIRCSDLEPIRLSAQLVVLT
jgi:hypothetical protein